MTDTKTDIAPWQTLEEGQSEDWTVMKLRHVKRQHAVDGRVGRFTVADAPGWVNILPITESGSVVLVEQFRHGLNAASLEIPGGVLHNGEDPRSAAERECLEETGYASSADAELLGVVDPNPAFMTNVCSVYLWKGCRKVSEQELDPLEDIRVVEVPWETFLDKVRSGEIRHSLVLSAVALFSLQGR